jgi:ABC-type polysaccharide/polyol phosphate transport system ATPase subunit
MTGQVVLQAEGLGRSYTLFRSPRQRLNQLLFGRFRQFGREFWALRDVSFAVCKGESVGIIGRNGSGKSTLLQLAAGILKPSEGSIATQGRIAALLELGAGFDPEFTGRENVYLNASLLGLPRDEVDAKFQSIVDFSELHDFIDQPVKTYSSGMFVRLAFSVQIHAEPDILIVDEALSVGDVFFQQKCMNRIRRMLDGGVTLFFVSHSIAAVKALCSKAVLLEHGRLVEFGEAEHVCSTYQNSESRADAVPADAASGPAGQAVPAARTFVDLDPVAFRARLSHRSGSGEVEFLDVRILDSTRRPAATFGPTPTLVIEAAFVAKVAIPPGAAIGVLIRDARGVDVVGINSDFFDKELPALAEGDRHVWETVVTLPLSRGAYSVHVGVKPRPVGAHFYDRCFNAAVFEIEMNPISYSTYTGLLVVQPRSLTLKAL